MKVVAPRIQSASSSGSRAGRETAFALSVFNHVVVQLATKKIIPPMSKSVRAGQCIGEIRNVCPVRKDDRNGIGSSAIHRDRKRLIKSVGTTLSKTQALLVIKYTARST